MTHRGERAEKTGGGTEETGADAGHRWVRLLLISAISGGLMYLSFPPPDLWPLAFVALVPVLGASMSADGWRGALACGAVAGLCAYLPALAWLSSVSIGGWLVLAMYLTAYLAALCVLARFFRRRYFAGWPVLFAMAWVGLELVRARFATGFPWLLYGYTQHEFTSLIQVAAATGVYGVSFLLVLLNAALTESLQWWMGSSSRFSGRAALCWTCASVLLVVLGAALGARAAQRVEMEDGPVLGAVQHNVPRLVRELVTPPDVALINALSPEQVRRLSPKQVQQYRDRIHEYYRSVFARIRAEIDKATRLSRGLKGRGVELLIWPETTIQEPLNPESTPHLSDEAREMQNHALESLRDLGSELDSRMLIGAPRLVVEKLRGEKMTAYGPDAQNNANSAYYMSEEAEILGRYDKMHLVPFGEYVPLRNVLPFLQVFTPMTRDLTPGTEMDIFSLPTAAGGTVEFGVLICYEDVVPSMVREFVGRGADFLVNITDEGWYSYPGELRQHAAMAVFRAVETRSTVVRAANTGISCFINPRGEIYESVQRGGNGRLRRNVAGVVAAPVKLTDRTTFYVRFGDAFAGVCAFLALVALGAAPVGRMVRRRMSENPNEE